MHSILHRCASAHHNVLSRPFSSQTKRCTWRLVIVPIHFLKIVSRWSSKLKQVRLLGLDSDKRLAHSVFTFNRRKSDWWLLSALTKNGPSVRVSFREHRFTLGNSTVALSSLGTASVQAILIFACQSCVLLRIVLR